MTDSKFKKLTVFTIALFVVSAAATPAFADGVDQEISYTVPVKDKNLTEFAQFSLVNASFERDADNIALQFDMPKNLVGRSHQKIILSGQAQPDQDVFQLNGDGGVATCRAAQDATTCNIRYVKQSTYTLPLALHLLLGDHYRERLKIAKQFSGDPIGIIHIKSKH